MDPISEMQIRALLLSERINDSSFPISPIQVHIIRAAFQIYKWDENDFFGVDFVTQDTDITNAECIQQIEILVEEGLLNKKTVRHENFYQISAKGIKAAKRIIQIFDNTDKEFSSSYKQHTGKKLTSDKSTINKLSGFISSTWKFIERSFFVVISVILFIKLILIIFK